MRPGQFVRCAATCGIVLLACSSGVRAQTPSAEPRQASPRGNAAKLPAIEPSTDQQKQALGTFANGAQTLNAFKVCLNNPDLCRAWTPFTSAVGRTLPLRDRELLILRTAWLCGNDYTWAIHSQAARRGGFSDEEIRRITEGPRASQWSADDRLLLEVADALYTDRMIPDASWSALAKRYNSAQMMDAIFTVGQYSMISMLVRSGGVQQESGKSGFAVPGGK
ncbi:MAG TPA: carboxymuconolactone decarboxylase family protein [Vicinamibacterales bacterium]|jgi:alkylhydroperoxidase family enzyme